MIGTYAGSCTFLAMSRAILSLPAVRCYELTVVWASTAMVSIVWQKSHPRALLASGLLPFASKQTSSYALVHTCTHAYMHASMATCMHAYMHMGIHTCMYTYIHANMYTYVHANMYTYIHAYMYTYMHAYMYTYMQTYMYTCIHACIHTLALPLLSLLLSLSFVPSCSFLSLVSLSLSPLPFSSLLSSLSSASSASFL